MPHAQEQRPKQAVNPALKRERDRLSVISAEKFNPDASAVTKKTTIARPIAILLATAALWGLASVIAERDGIHLSLKSASEELGSELERAR
jgi:hypothetical protein